MRVGVHQPQACTSQTLSRCEGVLQPALSPGMLHRFGLVHVALRIVDITGHFLVAKSFLGCIIGKDLPVVTRSLPATIGVVWM